MDGIERDIPQSDKIVTTKIGRTTWAAVFSPSDTVSWRRLIGRGNTEEEAVKNLILRASKERCPRRPSDIGEK